MIKDTVWILGSQELDHKLELFLENVNNNGNYITPFEFSKATLQGKVWRIKSSETDRRFRGYTANSRKT